MFTFHFLTVLIFVTIDEFNCDLGSALTVGRVINDVSELSIYYSPKDNHSITEMGPRPWYHPGWPLRLPFIGEPCTCDGLECGCCAGMKIPQLNFNQQACANLTYNPSEFAIAMHVFMNQRQIFENVISAKNPPPFCILVPIPYFPLGLVDFCIRLYDIHTEGLNVHVCMDWETRIDKAPVLVLHFDCMTMGANGVHFVKPGQNDLPTNYDSVQIDGDVYDPVLEKSNIAAESII